MASEKIADHDLALEHAKAAIAVTATKKWRVVLQTSPASAVNFVNSNPPQGAGEACFSVLPDGKVWVFYYL